MDLGWVILFVVIWLLGSGRLTAAFDAFMSRYFPTYEYSVSVRRTTDDTSTSQEDDETVYRSESRSLLQDLLDARAADDAHKAAPPPMVPEELVDFQKTGQQLSTRLHALYDEAEERMFRGFDGS